MSRPLPLSVPATVADCGRLRPGAEARHARNKQPPVCLSVSLPSSAVLLVAVAVARRCAPKGFKTAKNGSCAARLSVGRCQKLAKRKAAAVSPPALRLTCDVVCRQAALTPLRQVPHAALSRGSAALCGAWSADGPLAVEAGCRGCEKEKAPHCE